MPKIQIPTEPSRLIPMSRLNILKYTFYSLLFLTLSFTSFSPVAVLAQEVEESKEPASEESNQSDSSSTPSSIFSIEGGNKLMQEADQAIDSQDYDLAAQKLQSARQVFNQLSNFYLQLFNSVSQLDNVAAESHRKKALDTSIERDKATYQLALVHRAQNQSELSIPLLIQIITSQSPGIGLGKKAYDQLLEIGFVDTPITIPKGRSNNGSQNTPQNPAPAPNSQETPPPTAPDIQPAIPNQTIPDPSIPNP